MIENMILTSYSDKSYLVARWGGYVASIQMTSLDKLKNQVKLFNINGIIIYLQTEYIEKYQF